MQAQSASIEEQTCSPFEIVPYLSYYYLSLAILANPSATALLYTATLNVRMYQAVSRVTSPYPPRLAIIKRQQFLAMIADAGGLIHNIRIFCIDTERVYCDAWTGDELYDPQSRRHYRAHNLREHVLGWFGNLTVSMPKLLCGLIVGRFGPIVPLSI